VGAFLLTRLILYVTAAIAIRLLPLHPGSRAAAYLGKNLSLAALARWDSGWYLSIAERGYWYDPHGASSVAFFPLLPLLMKGLGVFTGNQAAAGLLIANLAALGAVLALYHWVRMEAGHAAAERAVLWLLVYPFSFYLHSIYAESLFFVLATLALYASAREQRLASGIWGALAAVTRPMESCSHPRWRGGSGGTGERAGLSVPVTRSPSSCRPPAWASTWPTSGSHSAIPWRSGTRIGRDGTCSSSGQRQSTGTRCWRSWSGPRGCAATGTC
jgi:hypothetical protein